MFNRDILCINGLVDGITKYKIYTAIHIEEKEGHTYYGLMDDYGVYNLFKESRFITVSEELINNIIKYNNGGINNEGK